MKTESDIHYTSFLYFYKLVNIMVKSNRQWWLKSVKDRLESQPKHFRKYVCNFKRKDNAFIQIKVNDQFVTEPKNVADALANHFQSILTHLV
jgi:hypothetical protein